MSKITSDDCKVFLMDFFASKEIETVKKDWKRVSKYKENDQWYRLFTNSNVGEIILVEKDNQLAIHEMKLNLGIQIEEDSSDSTKEYGQLICYQKQFTNEEKAGAKQLLKDYLAVDYTDNDIEQSFKSSPQWGKYYAAIPSQFSFHFPDDTYHNTIDNIDEGIDSQMKVYNAYEDSFVVLFTHRNGEYLEGYENDLLRQGILPKWTDFVDEDHLGFRHEAPDLTVKEWITYLINLGFEYLPSDCIFKDSLEATLDNSINNDDLIENDDETEEDLEQAQQVINKIKKQVEQEAIAEQKKKEIIDSVNALSALKGDDVNALKQLIKDGLDINVPIIGTTNLIVEAVKKNAQKCIMELLNHDIKLWSAIEGYNRDETMTVASEFLDNIYHNAHIYKDNNLIDILLDKMRDTKGQNQEHLLNKADYILSSAALKSKKRDYTTTVLHGLENLLSKDEISSVGLNAIESILMHNEQLAKDIVGRVEEKFIKASISRYALDQKYPVVAWLLDQTQIKAKEVMVGDSDLKNHMVVMLANGQNQLKKVANSPVQMVYSANGQSVSEIELIKDQLRYMYNLWKYMDNQDQSPPKNKM